MELLIRPTVKWIEPDEPNPDAGNSVKKNVIHDKLFTIGESPNIVGFVKYYDSVVLRFVSDRKCVSRNSVVLGYT